MSHLGHRRYPSNLFNSVTSFSTIVLVVTSIRFDYYISILISVCLLICVFMCVGG